MDAAEQERMVTGMLEAAENAAPVQAVAAVTGELRAALGAWAVAFLIADLSGRALVRLSHTSQGRTDGDRSAGGEVATVLPFNGDLREQALRTQRAQVVADPPGWTVFAPVTERGEAIGVLEMTLPAEPDGKVLDRISAAAHTLAFVVIANRRHTDLFEWGQRTTSFNLSAEIQRRLLPGSFTCEAGAFSLSGWLEPAASVGGDTFDYSLARDALYFSVTDAMGHGVASALTATLCVGSLRNSRRRGHDLQVQARLANEAVARHAAVPGSFVTAVLGRLDLQTGTCAVINAGHVPPLLVRDGATRSVALPRNFPLGMFDDVDFDAGHITLQPGDRLAIVTDGMRERNAADLDLPAILPTLTGLHPREAVRSLADAVLEITGPTLSDDATVLIVDWHGGHPLPRPTSAGADQNRASPTRPPEAA